MGWALSQQYLRDKLGFGPGGETGAVNDLVRRTFERSGAHIMGRRMFDGGERGWPEEAPFHTPVYVLTHTPRQPWVRPGGTTFHFVTDGPQRALALAREAAAGRGCAHNVVRVTSFRVRYGARVDAGFGTTRSVEAKTPNRESLSVQSR
jgi:dihydrofolate reductase